MAEFRIRQEGLVVAAANDENAILHYAMQYRADGPLTVQVKHMLRSGPIWKLHMQMAQFPCDTIKEPSP